MDRYSEFFCRLVQQIFPSHYRNVSQWSNSGKFSTDCRSDVPTENETSPWKFQVGDKVRISKYKHILEKSYLQNWTDGIFVVVLCHESNTRTYGLTDLLGEKITGRFYEQELRKVMKEDNDEYIVEKVLKTRRRNGKLEHFVKWQVYADKFSSWTTDVHRLQLLVYVL